MKFVCLVYIDEAKIGAVTPEESRKLTDDTIVEDWELERSGKLILSQPMLQPEFAKTLRVTGDTVTATDGPFAETKEHLGGLFIIEAADMAEAMAIAGASAILKYGSIEVRPTLEQTHSVTGEARPKA